MKRTLMNISNANVRDLNKGQKAFVRILFEKFIGNICSFGIGLYCYNKPLRH